MLNEYYDATAGAVIDGGGEVLRYIGDASLAIFPIERYVNNQQTCQTALDVSTNRGDLTATSNSETLAILEKFFRLKVDN